MNLSLTETLNKINENIGLLTEDVIISRNSFAVELNEAFKNTTLYNNSNFLNESYNLLMEDENKFLEFLFENAEMENALLDMCVLTFSAENTKLGVEIATFSLPAGWTCPFAKDCLKKVDRDRTIDPAKVGMSTINNRGNVTPYKGDITAHTGKDAKFDCYAAAQEMQYDALRSNRWHNYDLLKAAGTTEKQADLITKSLQRFFDVKGVKNSIRIHESGDFYSGEYLKAWMEVAKRHPDILFYAYTKSLPFIKRYESEINQIPNLSITLSEGGKEDAQLSSIDIKHAKVFNSPEEMLNAGLLIDLDDTLARQMGGKDKSFGLLVHGTQKAGEQSKNKVRNETFIAYWKYRKFINSHLGLPVDGRMTTEQALEGSRIVDDIIKNPEKYKVDSKISITHYKYLKKLLNYVVKYNKYGFSDDLINILPPKFKP